MATIINLRNWLEVPVEFKWDGELYKLDAGDSVKLPEGIARHGAKYIAMAHLNQEKKVIAQVTDEFINLVSRALEDPEEHASDTKAEVAIANDKSKKKAPKKKDEEEEVFEGLK